MATSRPAAAGVADLQRLTAAEQAVGQLASFGLPVMAKDPGAKLEAA